MSALDVGLTSDRRASTAESLFRILKNSQKYSPPALPNIDQNVYFSGGDEACPYESVNDIC